MAKSKATLDRSRPFATMSSINPTPKSPAYEQDGILFNSQEVECGKVEGYADRQKAAEKKLEDEAKAREKKAAAAKAQDILGDLDDPSADAKRENAAAAAAEEKAAED